MSHQIGQVLILLLSVKTRHSLEAPLNAKVRQRARVTTCLHLQLFHLPYTNTDQQKNVNVIPKKQIIGIVSHLSKGIYLLDGIRVAKL